MTLTVVLSVSVYFNYTQTVTTTNLSNSLTRYQNSVTEQQVTITRLTNEVTSLEEHPSTVTTTQTLVRTTTQTSTSVVSVYPVVSNVTLAFTQVSGTFDYSVTVGGATSTGSTNQPFALPLKNLFAGEDVAVQAATVSTGGCNIGETVTVQLWVEGSVAAQSTTQCTGSPTSLDYTV